jgi:hypothetical protein
MLTLPRPYLPEVSTIAISSWQSVQPVDDLVDEHICAPDAPAHVRQLRIQPLQRGQIHAQVEDQGLTRSRCDALVKCVAPSYANLREVGTHAVLDCDLSDNSFYR